MFRVDVNAMNAIINSVIINTAKDPPQGPPGQPVCVAWREQEVSCHQEQEVSCHQEQETAF